MPSNQRITFAAAITCLLLSVQTTGALADLTVCNKTEEPAGVAIAMKAGVIWKSKGWWTIVPERCKTILKGNLTEPDYYLHGVHYNVGGSWDGNETFCIDRGSFSIDGRLDCEARGYETASFLRIETGGKVNWQHNLADDHEVSAHGSVIEHSDLDPDPSNGEEE